MVKEVASKTSDVAGDGTTTATVLAQAIFREGVKTLAAGANPMALKRGIEKAVEAAVEEIKKLHRDVKGDMITQVGTISANNDRQIGTIIAEAMKKVGKDGVITVEESKTMETTLDVVEGMQFDRGYLSPYFVTNADRMECVLDDVRISDPRKEGELFAGDSAAAGADHQDEQAAADYLGGYRRRGAGNAGGEQAARHTAMRGGESAGIWRSPQVHAGRHRDFDRRKSYHGRPRHQARKRYTGRAGPRQKGDHRQGQDHDHRGRGQGERDRGAHQATAHANRRFQPRTTTRKSCRSGWPNWWAEWR